MMWGLLRKNVNYHLRCSVDGRFKKHTDWCHEGFTKCGNCIYAVRERRGNRRKVTTRRSKAFPGKDLPVSFPAKLRSGENDFMF